MIYETLLVTRDGVIGKLSFNRPDVLNAYNKFVSNELMAALQELADDDTVKVIVITGEGRAFMAGADINMVSEWTTPGKQGQIHSSLEEMFTPNMLEDCPKPIIAAVNGFAFGMGCEIAMGCDFRIATTKTKFALPEIKLGILPGAGGSQRMLHLVGATRALEMISTGDPIDAAEAYRIGLVNDVVEPEALWTTVEAFAARLTDKSALALASCKKLIYQGGNLPPYKGIEYERGRFCQILLTEDAAEGTKAFLEKRKPIYKNK
jgi:enoyl-CoA hydratase